MTIYAAETMIYSNKLIKSYTLEERNLILLKMLLYIFQISIKTIDNKYDINKITTNDLNDFCKNNQEFLKIKKILDTLTFKEIAIIYFILNAKCQKDNNKTPEFFFFLFLLQLFSQNDDFYNTVKESLDKALQSNLFVPKEIKNNMLFCDILKPAIQSLKQSVKDYIKINPNNDYDKLSNKKNLFKENFSNNSFFNNYIKIFLGIIISIFLYLAYKKFKNNLDKKINQ